MSNPNHKKFWCVVAFPGEQNHNRTKDKSDPFWNQVDRPITGYKTKEPMLFFTREEADKYAKESEGSGGALWRYKARKIKKEERK